MDDELKFSEMLALKRSLDSDLTLLVNRFHQQTSLIVNELYLDMIDITPIGSDHKQYKYTAIASVKL